MKHNQGFLEAVNAAKANIRETTVADVAIRIEKSEKFVLVNVREDGEFEADHLPGALHLGKGIIERDIEKVIPDKDTELALYCGGGFRSFSSGKPPEKGLQQRLVDGWRLQGTGECRPCYGRARHRQGASPYNKAIHVITLTRA